MVAALQLTTNDTAAVNLDQIGDGSSPSHASALAAGLNTSNGDGFPELWGGILV